MLSDIYFPCIAVISSNLLFPCIRGISDINCIYFPLKSKCYIEVWDSCCTTFCDFDLDCYYCRLVLIVKGKPTSENVNINHCFDVVIRGHHRSVSNIILRFG